MRIPAVFETQIITDFGYKIPKPKKIWSADIKAGKKSWRYAAGFTWERSVNPVSSSNQADSVGQDVVAPASILGVKYSYHSL